MVSLSLYVVQAHLADVAQPRRELLLVDPLDIIFLACEHTSNETQFHQCGLPLVTAYQFIIRSMSILLLGFNLVVQLFLLIAGL